MNRKGMSQTLALIVAAMVLMMTALSLIFMTQNSLQSLFDDSSKQSCVSAVDTQCSIKGDSGEINAPSNCEGVPDSAFTDSHSYAGGDDNKVDCSS